MKAGIVCKRGVWKELVYGVGGKVGLGEGVRRGQSRDERVR